MIETIFRKYIKAITTGGHIRSDYNAIDFVRIEWMVFRNLTFAAKYFNRNYATANWPPRVNNYLHTYKEIS